MTIDLLNQKDANTVMMSLGRGMGEGGFSEPELNRVLGEVHRMKLMGGMADLILGGEMVIRIEQGEITYQTAPDAEMLKQEDRLDRAEGEGRR